MRKAQKITLAASIALLIGAALPWASASSAFFNETIAGYEGDGMLTGIIGAVFLVVALIHEGKAEKPYSVVSVLAGLGALVISIMAWNNLNNAITESADVMRASIGAGLFVTLIGSVLLGVGGLVSVPSNTEPPESNRSLESDTPKTAQGSTN